MLNMVENTRLFVKELQTALEIKVNNIGSADESIPVSLGKLAIDCWWNRRPLANTRRFNLLRIVSGCLFNNNINILIVVYSGEIV